MVTFFLILQISHLSFFQSEKRKNVLDPMCTGRRCYFNWVTFKRLAKSYMICFRCREEGQWERDSEYCNKTIKWKLFRLFIVPIKILAYITVYQHLEILNSRVKLQKRWIRCELSEVKRKLSLHTLHFTQVILDCKHNTQGKLLSLTYHVGWSNYWSSSKWTCDTMKSTKKTPLFVTSDIWKLENVF